MLDRKIPSSVLLLCLCACEQSGALGGSGSKNSGSPKPAAEETGTTTGETLGSESGSGSASGSDTSIQTDEATSTQQYNDSEAYSPQNVSGAFLVCVQVSPPEASDDDDDDKGEKEADHYYGCAATLDDKNLLDIAPYDQKWETVAADGKSVSATFVQPPARSLMHGLFRTSATGLKAAHTVRLTLSGKGNPDDKVVATGQIAKDRTAPYPYENQIDDNGPCPVCPP